MIIKNLDEFINTPIKGVIHIGAHRGEEKSWYNDKNIKNVIWVEANPNYEYSIKQNVGEDLVIISAVGEEKKTVTFNIANNGQSSSVLEFGTHKKHHPEVSYVGKMEVQMDRMDNIIKEHNIDINDFNFINIDIQGYELQAFIGFGDLLKNFDYIYSEVNTGNVYDKCATVYDLDKYLANYNFIRVKEHITPFEWGDALYIKKD